MHCTVALQRRCKLVQARGTYAKALPTPMDVSSDLGDLVSVASLACVSGLQKKYLTRAGHWCQVTGQLRIHLHRKMREDHQSTCPLLNRYIFRTP